MNSWGVRQAAQPKVPVGETKVSIPLAVKTCGGWVAGETPSFTGEFAGETYRVLEDTQTHLPGNQYKKSPICLWVAEKTQSWISGIVPS